MDVKSITGNLATLFTIGVFLSGIEICHKIWKKRSTNDISALPFVCGLVSTSLWLRYGFLIHDPALIVVNGTGGGMQILYMIWYSKFNTNKVVFYKQVLVALSVIAFVFFYTMICSTVEDARFFSGMASCTAGVIFMGSPMANIVRVIRTRSTDMLPFPLIFCTFVMATLWVCYGVLINDLFVQVPNFLGALLALSQLCLFVIYPNKKPYYELSSVI